MIRVGESPDGELVTKFLGPGLPGAGGMEGLRGRVLAVSPDGKEAIVLALTTSFSRARGGVRWGRLYRVREGAPDEYARMVERVMEVPAEFEMAYGMIDSDRGAPGAPACRT